MVLLTFKDIFLFGLHNSLHFKLYAYLISGGHALNHLKSILIMNEGDKGGFYIGELAAYTNFSTYFHSTF